jgi:hypothetical protein
MMEAPTSLEGFRIGYNERFLKVILMRFQPSRGDAVAETALGKKVVTLSRRRQPG